MHPAVSSSSCLDRRHVLYVHGTCFAYWTVTCFHHKISSILGFKDALLLESLSKAAVTLDQVEKIRIYLGVPYDVVQRVRAEHKDASLCAVRVIQEFRNDCVLSPSEQDEMVASALKQSRLSAVATRVYQVSQGKMTPWDMLMKDRAQPCYYCCVWRTLYLSYCSE